MVKKTLLNLVKSGKCKKDYYLKDNEDYKEDVYRVIDLHTCQNGLGFFYICNNSKYNLKEKITTSLNGYKVLGNSIINVDLEPGKD